MTQRPDLLVSIVWLFLTLWVVAGSVAIVLGVAWLIALSAEAVAGFAAWVVAI